ncbi:hypothetical protein [[Clostridium] polysaccharolyticum]|uniref:Uncharacterized protein n=1 Tax=[Clostridium] polysaccharolyticum TaxID=29364 RepID=A0A1I0BF61_9FIRM|nr:hypothetical protein [[Clostridium] polysaccharolyticum]SET05516.1 hypothetical protein SAMN04487772_107106 [[Clostridium] polysaccharolyticum]
MKNQNKRMIKTGAVVLSATVIFSLGVVYAAHSFLNWTGNSAMVNAGIYIEQTADKIIRITNQNKALTKEKAELERELESLRQQLEEARQEEGWTEKDQQIADLNNQIIQKQNEVEHLTRELEAANSAAQDIQNKLDQSYSKLEDAGINIWD